jgi:hypothetical protein
VESEQFIEAIEEKREMIVVGIDPTTGLKMQDENFDNFDNLENDASFSGVKMLDEDFYISGNSFSVYDD